MLKYAKNALFDFCRKKSEILLSNMHLFYVITYINCSLSCRMCFNYIDKEKSSCYNIK